MTAQGASRLLVVVHVAQHDGRAADADLALHVGIDLVGRADLDDLVIGVGEGDADGAEKQPNIIPGVPTLFEALLRAEKLENADLSCLKGVFCGGDSLSIELKKKGDEFLKAHNASVQIRQGYGLTECVTASCLTPYHISREGSII